MPIPFHSRIISMPHSQSIPPSHVSSVCSSSICRSRSWTWLPLQSLMCSAHVGHSCVPASCTHCSRRVSSFWTNGTCMDHPHCWVWARQVREIFVEQEFIENLLHVMGFEFWSDLDHAWQIHHNEQQWTKCRLPQCHFQCDWTKQVRGLYHSQCCLLLLHFDYYFLL